MKKTIILTTLSALLFNACTQLQQNPPDSRTPADTSNHWALLPFTRIDSVNPVLKPGAGIFTDPVGHLPDRWEAKDVFNPAIVSRDGKIYMLYRAQDESGTSRIGLAVSADAMHFTRAAKPVLYPADDGNKKLEWPGGCEDPRIVQDEKGMYFMTYTGYDGHMARLLIATSTDLLHWTKHGSVFAKAYKGEYANKWSKSGSIVSAYKDGKVIATKINGKYWMYWGDTQIWVATSDNLLDWSPVEMMPGERPPVPLRSQALNMPRLKIVLPTRKGKFDSDLVESGPPAMQTDKGILLLYNSRNLKAIGDTSLADGTYSASQVLFDAHHPTRILRRMSTYFLTPKRPYELTGQVNQVCFIEGLAEFKSHWYLYYGTADSKIAVAIK